MLLAAGADTYDWSPTDSISNPLISNPLVWPTSTTTYQVIASYLTGCSDTTQVTITVNPSPVIDAGLDQTICVNDTVQLNASGGISYLWSPTDSLSASNISNPLAWPSDSTQYVVTGTDANNCSSNDTVNVFVNPLPAVDAGLSTAICLGDSAQLQATGADTYLWSPAGSLNNPAISNPLASPAVTTTYLVTASDTNTCVNVDSVVVSINSLPTATVSNDTTICLSLIHI